MATRTIVTLIDDLDGSKADQRVSFSLQGKTYELDLSNENMRSLMTALQPYVEAAKRSRGLGSQ